MATQQVGIQLSLTGARQAQQGVAGVSGALGTLASRMGQVTRSAASMAAGMAGAVGNAAVAGVQRLAGAFRTAATAATAVGTAAAVSLIRTGIGYNDLEQKARAAFTTILGSGDAANRMMDDIAAFGKTSPFPRQAFISATQQMLGFGFAAGDIIPTLTAINDATAAMGGNADTIATITDTLSQVRSSGKLTAETLNRLGAVGINAAQLIGNGMHMSAEQVRSSITEGSLDAGKALTALTTQMGKRYAGASERVKETWSGAVDRIKGAWRDLGSALVEPFVTKGGGGLAVAWANNIADGLRKAANAAPLIITMLRTGSTDQGALGKILDPTSMGKVLAVVQNLRTAFGAVAGEAGHYSTNLSLGQAVLDALVWGSGVLLRAVQGVVGVFALLARGDYTTNLASAFGWAEDSAPVDFLLRVRDGFQGLVDLVGSGDYTGKLRSAFGWEEDSGAVGFILDARTAIAGLGAAIAAAVGSGDLSKLGPAFSSIGDSLVKLGPAFSAIQQSLPQIIVPIVNGLASALGFLAAHVDTLVKWAPLIAAGFVAWRVSLVALNAVTAITQYRQLASNLVTLRSMAATRAHTLALQQYIATVRGVSLAEVQAEGSARVGLLTRLRATAALVAQRVATVATTIATKAAAAGQWLLNAAMSANPIGVVIALVAGLVAGLVWFFTKTEVGRQAWAAFTGFLTSALRVSLAWITGTAWPAIQSFFSAIGGALDGAKDWWNRFWNTTVPDALMGGVRWLTGTAWPAIVGVFDRVRESVTGAVQLMLDWIKNHWQLVVGILTGPIGFAVAQIITHWSEIKAGGAAAFDAVRTAIGKVTDKLQAFIDKVRDAVTWIGTKLRGAITSLPGGSAALGLVDKVAGALPGFATGGQFYAGQPMVVGERGPEVILPTADGEVIPNHRLSQLSAGDTADLSALASAATGTQVIQLVVDRKVLAQATVGHLAATQARS